MTESPRADEIDGALHAALTRTLTPPAVPAQFRAQLQAALARAAQPSVAEMRGRLEQEQREKLAQLEADYVRLRRRTLGTMIGGAFAAGAIAALTLPWLTAHLGPSAPVVIASVGATIGLWIGLTFWLNSRTSSAAHLRS